ncbi:MAG TPA: DUF4386 family protein [Saprospiraceae bacterium]|nr:DUF4386 family protein [Saprospiraceae bacterium]HNT22121.1 DUF4386 family protein [Saprospiraceae bacterium]
MKFLQAPWKISGMAGVLFVALSFIASGMNKMPPRYNQEISTFVSWFSENGDRYRFGHFLAGLAFLLFYFPFFSGFCEVLRKAEGEPSIWTRVTWAGAIMSPAAGTVAGAFIMGIVLLNGNASPELSQFGMAGNFYAYTVSGAYGGIAMIGSSVIILKTNIFKRWLGWAGLVIGSTAIISIGTLVENNPQGLFATINGFAWLAYFLWIGVLSIELIKRKETRGGKEAD